MNTFKTLTIDGQTYTVASGVRDDVICADATWSSEKIHRLMGTVEETLDGIIAIQNRLTGGDGV